jgi:hypothetical protein
MPSVRVTLYEDKDVLVECDYLFNRSKIAMHVTFEGEVWSHCFLKKLLDIYKGILDNFKKEGYTEIYGAPVKGNIKAKKLAKMFGFENYFENNDLYLMRMEIN